MNNNFFCYGTSFHDDIIMMSYNDLVKCIGEPNFNELSVDGKTQKEWNITTNDGVFFTIYDYRMSHKISGNRKIEWHIGYSSYNEENNLKSIVLFLKNKGVTVISKNKDIY